jgi:hypothetical protein
VSLALPRARRTAGAAGVPAAAPSSAARDLGPCSHRLLPALFAEAPAQAGLADRPYSQDLMFLAIASAEIP